MGQALGHLHESHLFLFFSIPPFLSSIFPFQALIITLAVMDTQPADEKETHDFMNVESFSQLPFIRPPAPAVKEKGIRLFGIEFGGGDRNTATVEDSTGSAETTIKENNESNINEVDINRRFECHYCCRNFPTSQALGGHQNAHKRERQNAKRAHFQSAMVHNSLAVDAHHIYGGLLNYSRLTGPAPPSPSHITTNYPSWTGASTTSHRFYGSHSSYSHHQAAAAINGSPLGLWRIPGSAALQNHDSFNRDRSMQHPLPLFASDQELKPSHMQVGVGGGSSSQSRFVYDYESKPSSQDHVSLDLHL